MKMFEVFFVGQFIICENFFVYTWHWINELKPNLQELTFSSFKFAPIQHGFCNFVAFVFNLLSLEQQIRKSTYLNYLVI